MKILYLITKSESGGAQTHIADLCVYFKKRGFEIAVMSFPGGWLENETQQNGIKFYPNVYFSNNLNPINVYRALREIKMVVSEFKPDIVHCHSSAAGVLARLVVRNKIPTIFTAHGWSFNVGVPVWQKWLGILSEKICGFYTTKIIAVCNFVQDYGLKYHVAPLNKFIVIYNGVKTVEPISKNISDKIRLVFVGRLATPKDPLLLLEAIADSSIKELVELSIIGTGMQKDSLEEFVKLNKLKQVKFLGSLSREQVFGILIQSDIFVLPTNWEGFPYTILEAMSYGLPVIAANVGGIREVVTPDVGFLFKKGDSGSLKTMLEKLVIDSDLRTKMGIMAKNKVKNKFSLEATLAEVEKVYMESVLLIIK